ncbi:hypothetical protein JXC34_06800 [Candidatus Woesearchaeota archaeon]|nr:hypothetical protein [Candidatus Woesearchaeota archaeon]
MAKTKEDIDDVFDEDDEEGFMAKVGPWSFILGLLIAVFSALTGSVFWLLGALGLVVGLLNITDRELNSYLLASLTFLVSANALSVTLTNLVTLVPVIGEWLNFINPLLANITLFVAPGAGIVALKALYKISRD